MTGDPAKAAPGEARRGRRRVLFWLRAVAAVFLLAVLALWAALESDPAAEKLRTLLESRGSAMLGAPVHIGDLDLDVLPFHLELRDVRVGLPGAAAAHGEPGPTAEGPLSADRTLDDALAHVDRLALDLSPWGLLDRRISILDLELDRPAVRLDLPFGTGEGGGPGPMRLEIRRLRVRDGNLVLRHRTAGFGGELQGVSLQLAPEREGILVGPFATGVGQLRVAGGRLDLAERNGPGATFEPVEVDASFALERSTLIVDRALLVAGDSRIEAKGPVHGLDGAELDLQADMALADIFKLWRPPGPDDHAGRASFRGSLELRAGAPVLAGRISTREARLAGLPLESFAGDLQLRRQRVLFRNVRARLLNGSFTGSLDVDRSASPARTTLVYQVDAVDAAALTRWPPLDGLRVSGTLDASGSLVWSETFSDTVTGDGDLRLDLPGASTVELARRLSDAWSPAPQVRDEREPPGDGHAVPALPLPARAEIRWRVADGTLSLQDSTLYLPSTTVSVDGRLDFDGQLLASARVESTDLRMVDHLVAQYRELRQARDREEVEPPGRFGLRGAATAQLELRGSARAPVLTGQVDARALGIGDLDVGDVTATLRPEPGTAVLEPLRISRQGGTADGSARLRLAGDGAASGAPEYDLRLHLERYRLAAGLALASRQRPASAVVTGDLWLQGASGGAPTLDFDVEAAPAALDGLDLDRVVARGRTDDDGIVLESVAVRGLGGSAAGSASWRPGTRSVSADLELQRIDLAAISSALRLQDPLAGALDGRLRVSGPIERLDGEAAMTWTDGAVAGLPTGTIVAAARAEGGVVAARALGHPGGGGGLTPPPVPRTTTPGSAPTVLPAPAGGWTLSATVGTRAPYPAAVRVRSEAGAAAGLLQRLGQPLPPNAVFTGQLDGRGRGDLSGVLSWRGTVAVSGFRVQQPPGFSLASERIEARLEGGRVTADAALQSELGPFAVSLATDLESRSLEGRLDGTIAAAALRLWKQDLSVDGTAHVALQLGGTLSDPVLTGGVEVRDFAVDQGWMYPVSSTAADLTLRGDVLHVTRLEGRVGDTPFSASGTLPLAALLEDASQPEVRSSLDATVSELPVDPVIARSAALSRLVSGGSLSIDVHLEGRGLDPGALTGRVDVRALDIRMRDYDWSLHGATGAVLRDGRIELPEGARITGGRTDFALGGSIDLAPLSLDLSIDGRVGLEPLNVISPMWGAGGTAIADLRVHGPVDDLLFRGNARLQQVVLSPPPLRQPIEGISARLELDDRRVRILELEGELGGGSVDGGGELFLRRNVPQSFRFTLEADNALVRLERQVQVRISANLVHDGTPERSLLSGSVRLLEGRYRRVLEADDAILELLEAPETDPDPVLESVGLDLQVLGDRGLHIDNNLAEVDVTADFDVRGTLAEPVLLGRSVLLGGELYWNDHVFEVLRGTVEFNNPFHTEPFFEVSARTDIRRYTVNLNFTGSFERGIAFDYTSTPTLSDLDLFNLLAFGEEPDSEVLQNPYRYQRALGLQATRYLTDAYLSEVERGAERIFGVDRFRIAPTLTGSETDATARLTIGKRLTSNLYVTYSRLLSNSEDQLLTVEYQLSPTTRLKGTRDEDGSFGIDFLVQKRIR